MVPSSRSSEQIVIMMDNIYCALTMCQTLFEVTFTGIISFNPYKTIIISFALKKTEEGLVACQRSHN